MCTCNIYVVVFVVTIKETNIHNHAKQKYHGLCKKIAKAATCVCTVKKKLKQHVGTQTKNVDENTDVLKSYVKQMNMQKPTRKVSCMIE
jgi:hypothetical protein